MAFMAGGMGFGVGAMPGWQGGAMMGGAGGAGGLPGWVPGAHISKKAAKEAPTFLPVEAAIRHEYDPSTGRWTKSPTHVQLASKPFNSGTLRIIYHMKDLSLPEGQQDCVSKVSKDPMEQAEGYFLDVEMQGKAKQWADVFSSKNPPKRIDFILPYIVEFKNRRNPAGFGALVMGVERVLHGEYKKHTNNYGFVSPDDRNTPQAFSHFTYYASNGRVLVCDIQGVGDVYTDPQIHSGDGSRRWGKADMGPEGIARFFGTHRCNAICEYLKLPVHSGKKKAECLPAGVRDDNADAAKLALDAGGMSSGMASSGALVNFTGMQGFSSGLTSGLPAGWNGLATGGLSGFNMKALPMSTSPAAVSDVGLAFAAAPAVGGFSSSSRPTGSDGPRLRSSSAPTRNPHPAGGPNLVIEP